MFIKFNLKAYNVLEKKNLLERFRNKICKEGNLIYELSNAIQLYHFSDKMNGVEYYQFDIIPDEKIKNYTYSIMETKWNRIKAAAFNCYSHYFTYFSIQIKFLYKENILEIFSNERFVKHFLFRNQSKYKCKILDKKDLNFIKQINTLFFNGKDDVINTLVQTIII